MPSLQSYRYAFAFLVALVSILSLPSSASAGARTHQSTPFVVVLDPGHGGSDIGAVDPSQSQVEKVLTLQVARLARLDLRAMGYTVYLTRTRDQAVNTPPRDLNHDGSITHVDEYTARSTLANRHHANIIVSIHFDASPSPDTHGTHGYYCPARPFWRQSKRLALSLTSSLAASLTHTGYASPNNGIETDVADVVPQTRPDYPWFLILGPSLHHFVTATNMPGALIESLYLTSPRDIQALHKSSTVRALAHGYADGIRAYFTGQIRH